MFCLELLFGSATWETDPLKTFAEGESIYDFSKLAESKENQFCGLHLTG